MTIPRISFVLLISCALAACGGPTAGPGDGPPPGPPPGPPSAGAQVSAGWYHSLALAADGRAYAWGWNLYGELGTGDTTLAATPTAVSMPAGVQFVQIGAGGLHSVALTDDGRAYAWGRNDGGAVGDGTALDRHAPVPVAMPAGTTLTAVSAGGNHNLGITHDGRVFAWGDNTSEQVGDGAPATVRTPVPVVFPDEVAITAVAAGGAFSLALDELGNVYAWGANLSYTLGDGTNVQRGEPRRVPTPEGVPIVAIAAGSTVGLALDDDGDVHAWGYNYRDWLGSGDFRTPVRLDLPPGLVFTDVHAGAYLAMGRTADGTVHAWGRNSGGQVGDGSTENRSAPVSVALPTGVRFERLDVGEAHTVALGDDGRVYAWGDDSLNNGRVGDGSLDDVLVPVRIALPSGP